MASRVLLTDFSLKGFLSQSRARARGWSQRGLTVALFSELEDVLPAHDSPGLPLAGAVCLKCCTAVPVGRAMGFSLLALPTHGICVFLEGVGLFTQHVLEGLSTSSCSLHVKCSQTGAFLRNTTLYIYIYICTYICFPLLPHKKL